MTVQSENKRSGPKMADGNNAGNENEVKTQWNNQQKYDGPPPPYPGTGHPPPADGLPPGYSPAPPGTTYQYPVPGVGMPPPPHGQASSPGFNRSAYTTVQPVLSIPTISTTIIVRGNCPGCGIGTLRDEFTCCGIALAVIFFPIGLVCCVLLRDRRCTHCGASF